MNLDVDRAAVICAPGRWPSSFNLLTRQLALLGIEPRPVMGDDPAPPPAWFRSYPGSWQMGVAFRSIVQAAIRDGVGTLAIFEDDATLAPGWAATLDAFEPPGDWEVVYLGFNAMDESLNERLGPNLLRLRGSMATHACLYRASVLPKLLEMPRDRPVDEAIAAAIQPEGRSYACWPMAIVQAPGLSQITGEMGAESFLWESDGAR